MEDILSAGEGLGDVLRVGLLDLMSSSFFFFISCLCSCANFCYLDRILMLVSLELLKFFLYLSSEALI